MKKSFLGFETKAKLVDYVRSILYRSKPGREIRSGKSFSLLKALVKNHYHSEWIIGPGIDYFFVTNCHINRRNKKFNVMRVDGTYTDFSYRKAVSGTKSKANGTPKKKGKFIQDYRGYLKSDRWKGIRNECLSNPTFKECSVVGCCKTKIHIHHTSYNRLGTKDEIKDLVPLCGEHHQQVHDLHNKDRKAMTLLEATMEIVNQH